MEAIELDIVFHLETLGTDLENLLEERFQHAAQWLVEKFKLESLQLSIAVVDDPTIHQLNREQLNHDWPTDVISFGFDPAPLASGEIIASWDTAERLSEKAGWRPADELVLYAVHGMLHIVGLDDLDDESRMIMRQHEFEYLKYAKIPGYENYLARFDDVSY
ncbi:MAG: rRNA maturation RNase YbeY [Pirellulales bacterium]